MAITTKTVFETTDGKTFADQSEATAHQVKLDTASSLADYVSKLPLKSVTAKGRTLSENRVKRTVLGYLAWLETGAVPGNEDEDEGEEAEVAESAEA